jgi:hypothetical protein
MLSPIFTTSDLMISKDQFSKASNFNDLISPILTASDLNDLKFEGLSGEVVVKSEVQLSAFFGWLSLKKGKVAGSNPPKNSLDNWLESGLPAFSRYKISKWAEI